MSKFTPGPWEANCETLDDGTRFCSIHSGREYLAYLSLCPDQLFANARLIAAAPDYDSAATAVLYEFDQYYDVDDGIGNLPGPLVEAINKLRHAKTKAEGKT